MVASLPVELRLALGFLKPQRSFVSVITVLSVLGVITAVMVLIVVLSVMAGFERELRDKVIGFHAHLTLSNQGILGDHERIAAELRAQPGVEAAAPFVAGPVVVNCRDRITTPVLRGIDLAAERRAFPVERFLISGSAELLGEAVLVGKAWAQRHGVWVGDKLLVFAPRQIGAAVEAHQAGAGGGVLPTELVIVGIFETGMFDFDVNYVLTSIENAQYLYRLDSGVHGISIRVRDLDAVPDYQRRWQAHYEPPIVVRTWMDQNRALFEAIAVERVAMSFVLFFIMIVAAFGLCSTLITVTVQKTREIGMLKAMGASSRQVCALFIWYGAVVGVVGAVAGVAAALGVLAVRNDFRRWLAELTGVNLFSPDIYHFAQIPSELSWPLVAIISGAGLLVCIAAAWIPAWSASRIPPAQAVRV